MRRAGPILAAALAAALIVGCGGSSSDEASSSELTGLAPAGSLVYVEGALKPEGDLQSNIDSLLGKFPQGDQLGEQFRSGIEESLKEDDPSASYEEDIEPWLGERAAFFLTDLIPKGNRGDVDIDGAFVAETSDAGEAETKIGELLAEGGNKAVEEREYNGISYDFAAPQGPDDTDATAAAMVDDTVVLGTEPGLKAAIDASEGESFEAQQAYADFSEQDSEGRLGSFFVDAKALVEKVPPSPDFNAQDRQALESVLGGQLEQPVLGALDVAEDEVTIEYTAGSGPATASAAAQTPLLDAGPADAWAVFGASDVGKYVGQFLGQIQNLGVPQAEFNAFQQQLRQATGIELSDFSALGDIAVFAAGESIVELQVGAVVEATDAAARERLLNGLRQAVQRQGDATVEPLELEGAQGFSILPNEFPIPINAASMGDRVVIAGGDEATETLLSGDGGLTGSGSFTKATRALGEGFGVNLLLEMAPILSLAESTGGGDDPDFMEALPYLEPIDFLTVGTEQSGDTTTTRVVVEVP